MPFLPVESKEVGLFVRPAEDGIADDLGGYLSERDAIPAIAEREIRIGPVGMRAAVGQAVARFAECAGPRERDVQVDLQRRDASIERCAARY
jgi:hypothetical protein